ncbi:hypothetical protein GCM10007973_08500 [Polymorphobacter multimanifer]|uniref:VIT1/CCC1 family predicted Fe2+/Mn2+ transporter n=1 Tax=Polymorphobacter multimanifer TaxID=1070431 RepID=A0A841LFX3_9SPHN|nr:hypothetical protein [Polymorphobacter multimanifer]MBB6228082.1 VIT1/CCC1 family predicted Fe2+/Mn2+ transporter [Polymorphobacter multimanifer]GGI73966.1 hypothetical protein GCM10007973_08500 [Polymorphobacter multimanifer]
MTASSTTSNPTVKKILTVLGYLGVAAATILLIYFFVLTREIWMITLAATTLFVAVVGLIGGLSAKPKFDYKKKMLGGEITGLPDWATIVALAGLVASLIIGAVT